MKQILDLITKNRANPLSGNDLNCRLMNSMTKGALTFLLIVIAGNTFAQVPSLTYSGYGGPENYTVGTAITTLTPTNSGGTIVARGQTTVFAGSTGNSGYINATGILALFTSPNGLTVDGSGNVYVADNGNNVIRKISSAGVVTTLAGSGSTGYSNGTGTAASFTHPTGVCVDASGNVYVADAGNDLIRKITSAGVVTTLAGTTGSPGHADGTGTAATFYTPTGVALDGSGNLFVADYTNNEIRKIVISTAVVTTFAGSTTSGSTNGTGTAARFNNPSGITIDGSGNLYIADFSNNMIRKSTSAAVVTTLAGSTTAGSADGTGTAASFYHPAGISLNGSSNIYVADDANGKVRMITTSGVVTTYTSSLNTPYGITVNSSGTVFLSESGANTIDKISAYNYSISPALSMGLSFNTSTGAISGTPVATSPSTDYTISAISSSGTGSVILNFTVGILSPSQASIGFVQSETIDLGIINDTSIYALSDVQKQTTRVYYDGLGRGIQTVALQASPAQNDLIQPMAYDNLGRPVAGYLPYAGLSTDAMGSYRSNALTPGQGQPLFYNQTGQYLIAKDTAAHANNVYEKSPLQRLQNSGMVGAGYQPEEGGTQHYKTVIFRYNKTTDGSIPIWNPDGSFTTGNYYATSSLSVTDGKDEDGTETLAFTDKSGHLILKRQKLGSTNLDTYYIYNMAGMLSYIVPPQAIYLMGGSYSLTTTGVPKLYFHYIYDTMGRITQKTVPAKGTMYMVYDPMNRPVLTQDSNMRASNKWAYVKYDAKERPVSSGVYTDGTHTTVSSMQTYVSGISYSIWYESRSSNGSSMGYYTNSVFPTSGTTPLSYAYFDDYDLQQTGSDNYSYVHQGLTNEDSVTTAKVKGMPTMTWKTTIGSGVTSGTWLLKVNFYDKRLNPIQTRSSNHVYYVNSTTLTDTATVVPDFAGMPQVTLVKKKSSSTIVTKVQTNTTYDQMYRIKKIDQYYNGSATATHIDTMMYNELGQVIEKSLGKQTSAWLQNVNYRYNIRGQLVNINNSKLANDTGKTSNDTNDLFGMQLLYDQVDANLSNAPYYSGKLSAVKWMSSNGTGGTSYERAFKYYYDAVNRDTAAIYAERTAASTSNFTVTNGWNENRITYDYNGNIKTLFRDSTSQGSGGHTPIDNLTYTYSSSNPNQLQSVTDGTGSAYTNSGFRNYTGSAGNYAYDGNGNLKNDPYKGLNLTYDVLNRTDTIYSTWHATNRYITYTYDADGNLLRKKEYDNNTLGTTTDYVDGFIYITQSGTTTLSYFAMPEGRVVNSGGTLIPTYVISDQQGNARIEFDNTGTGGTLHLRQENSYYAFGLIMPGSTVATPSNPNLHLYNGGSEWQNDYSNLPNYYQTYFRNYDAALARWVGVDPEADGAESMSSYQYSGNNPIMYNDPLGNLNNPTGGQLGNSYMTPSNAHLDNGVLDQEEADQEQFEDNIVNLNSGGGLSGVTAGFWWSSGPFDSPGNPFSGDHGAAGYAFWAPATRAGGDWSNEWNIVLGYMGAHVGSDGKVYLNGKPIIKVGPVTQGSGAGTPTRTIYHFGKVTVIMYDAFNISDPGEKPFYVAPILIGYDAPQSDDILGYNAVQFVTSTNSPDGFIDTDDPGDANLYLSDGKTDILNRDLNNMRRAGATVNTVDTDTPGTPSQNFTFNASTTIVTVNSNGTVTSTGITIYWGYQVVNGVPSSFIPTQSNSTPQQQQNAIIQQNTCAPAPYHYP